MLAQWAEARKGWIDPNASWADRNEQARTFWEMTDESLQEDLEDLRLRLAAAR